MEFWGVEVKAGQPLKVTPEAEEIVHISQATLGESKKKGNDSVPIYVTFEEKKLVLGTLSADKFPQIAFDLVFEKEFELSHNWSGGSVFFMGYKSVVSEEDDYSDMGTDSEEEDLPISLAENGKPGLVAAKPALAKAKSAEKPKAIAEAAKGKGKGEESDDSDDDSDHSAEDESDDEEGSDSGTDSDEDEDDSDEDDEEETPKKADAGKKRPVESASKTPDAKKAKLTTPQKTDGKKGGHTATPHPAKQVAKTPASNKKDKPTPNKSGGAVTCNSCSKTFNSEKGLQSHNQAKHAAK